MASLSTSPFNNSTNLGNNAPNTSNNTTTSSANTTTPSPETNLDDLTQEERHILARQNHARDTTAARLTAETDPAMITEFDIDHLDQKDSINAMDQILNNVEGRTPTLQEFTVMDLVEKAMEWMKHADFNNQAQDKVSGAQYLALLRRRQLLRRVRRGEDSDDD